MVTSLQHFAHFAFRLFSVWALFAYAWVASMRAVCVCLHITKTFLYNTDPLKPPVYIVQLGLTMVYIIFLIFAQKHRLWYSLEPPRRGGSNEYPQSMF